jgi:hypothetical protein
MKCANHSEIDAAGVCVVCGKPFCAECIGVRDNRYYCQKHLEGPAPEAPGRFKPGLAAVMNFLPGLGYLYLGLYDRALVAFLAFFAFTRLEGPLVLAVIAFAAVDGHRQARALNAAAADAAALPAASKVPLRVVSGTLLIVIGFLYFLEQAGVDLEALSAFWPVLFIGLGIWMIWSHLRRGKSEDKPEDGPAGQDQP